MNIFEFENERFGNVWTDETIAECRQSIPQRTSGADIFPADEIADEKYREYQEQNLYEYYTGSYKYCLWK